MNVSQQKGFVKAFNEAAELLIESEKPLFLFPAFVKVASDHRQAVLMIMLWRSVFNSGGNPWELEDREPRALGCLFLAEIYNNLDTFVDTFKKLEK